MSSPEDPISPADVDNEKGIIEEHVATSPPSSSTETSKPPWFKRWNARIEGLAGFEARGLARVHESERHPPSKMALLQMLLLWFSANLTINNLAVTLTGPLLFGLGFVDCALCAIFGVALGALSTAYMATWGAVSGNRTMVRFLFHAPFPKLDQANPLCSEVVARFFMGYYPAKIVTLLDIILMEGYATIDCIIGGQVLSAVSGGSMSIAVGIAIVALVEVTLAAFGLKVFHVYER